MKYISTRGQAEALNFDDVLLAGLARDGGLYLPESWPQFSAEEIRDMAGQPYTEIVFRVVKPFVAGVIPDPDLKAIVEDSYADFRHSAVAPLKQINGRIWVMELFHGPTLAFKDFALQMLGRLFDYVLKKRGERITIVGATSGDTGSAAIEACRDRDQIDIFILHPHGRVSEVQRRQMTTVTSHNVINVALEGTFDDCQDHVKAMFNDQNFRDSVNLSAVNSINWARIMSQIAYYFAAGVALGAPDRPVGFSVPTGNFGNVFAAYAAGRMGLPVSQLIVGSNRNDILTRFFETGSMTMNPVEPSLSPSMDIQVSSNFERLLFDLLDQDGQAVEAALTSFREKGNFDLEPARHQRALRLFDAYRLDDGQTLAEIKKYYEQTGELFDPHSVIAVAAAVAKVRDDVPAMACMATAHPAKFPDAVHKASGVTPELPEHMADLFDREEQYKVMENDLSKLKDMVLARRRNS
ncbi:threonine synthase [Kiloniella majae]|uniref:threonine synthase n=1 Tax=Kiloniella majae TaxID=1938558 RepID=UPI000A27741C|nr:threonine synthase [Kiloniella majae]